MPLTDASHVIARIFASPGSWKRTNDPALAVIVVSATVIRETEVGDGDGDDVTVGAGAVTLGAGLGIGPDAVGVQPIAITATSASADRRAMV
jgi:hypothetical protein